MKRIFILVLLVFACMLPKNAFAASIDLIDKIQIFNGDGSNSVTCDENNPTSCLSNMNNTKSFKLFWSGSKINANYTIDLIFRLYVDKGTIPEATLQDVYLSFLGNVIDDPALIVVNQRLDNTPEVSETYYDTYRYQLTIAPINVSTSSDLQSFLEFGFTYPLTGQVTFEVINFKVSSSLDPPDTPDYTQNLDDIKGGIADTNDKLDDLNSNLTNEDSPDVYGFLDDLKVDDSNSPVSDLITMPLTLIQSYVNGFSSSCSSVSLGNLLGYDLVFPCIDLKNYLGETLFTLIDMLFCLFMVYNIGMMCISIYESITSLDDNMQLLYSPQHAGNSRVSKGEMEGLY